MIDRLLTLATNRIYSMPVLVLMPHSRCNCRCVMCDIWKSNHDKREISPEDLEKHVESFRRLGVRHVTLSGGEALMHANLWNLCKQLREIDVKISLLSTGILIAANAEDIIRYCDDVIVSLDGSPGVHNMIRNIPSAYEKLEVGIKKLKGIDQKFPVTGRCVLQKSNFRDFPNIISTAKHLELNQISFLTADVSSSAFNHGSDWKEEKHDNIILTLDDVEVFEDIIRKSFIRFEREYQDKFIAESQSKVLSFVQYYRAIHGAGEYPRQKCNAPWVSGVIESNGDVMPCFFHKPYGNISNGSFEEIVNSDEAILFRRKLDITRNETCKKCVCSLYLGA